MDIATWNVNSIKARLPFVLHWLDEREPDIVCLQELKVDADKFPHEELEKRGYHASIHAQPTWNGVAVLSKEPAEILQSGLPGAEDAGARLVTARIGDITAVSVYVPNGKTVTHDDYQLKLDFMRALDDYVKDQLDAGKPTLVAGDFNITPEDVDSWAPSPERIFHTDRERKLLSELVELGYRDAYRVLEPEGDMYSWWDYRAGSFHKNQGLRIDLLMASEPLLSRIEKVWVDRDYRKKKDGHTPSDHAPVIARIR
jgi:exodeoxyribonuclease-3